MEFSKKFKYVFYFKADMKDSLLVDSFNGKCSGLRQTDGLEGVSVTFQLPQGRQKYFCT